MILQPTYYNKFKCIASKCNDNCCIGWEISVDKESYKYYMSIKSEFSQKLHNGILKNEDEYSFKLEKNKRCVFLNKNNLCEIICNLGENSLCQICRDHPRYYNFYNNVQENGLGLACEEVCRIILTEKSPINFIDTSTNKICNIYSTDDIYLNFLLAVREIIINTLHNRNFHITARLAVLAHLCDTVQQLSDSSYTDLQLYNSINELANTATKLLLAYHNKYKKEQCIKQNILPIISDFTTLEILDKEWLEILKNAVEQLSLESCVKRKANIFSNNFETMTENMSVYLVQRYFLESYFDNQIRKIGVFIVISNILITSLININFSEITIKNIISLVHSFSKEIEYSDQNIDRLYELFTQSDIYRTENIIDILLS